MFSVLRTIVVGEGESGRLRQRTEGRGNSMHHLLGCLACHFSQAEQAAFAFARNAHSGETLARDDGVSFPMAKLLAFFDMAWPLVNGGPVADIGVFSAFSLTSQVTPLAPSPKIRSEIKALLDPVIVYILVNCLGTDPSTGNLPREHGGNLLRRPSTLEFAFNVSANSLCLQPWSLMSPARTFLRTLVCTKGKV